MEQEEVRPNLAQLDFNEDTTYAFLKVEDKKERDKKFQLLQAEAIERGQKELFERKVKALQTEEKPTSCYELSSKGSPLKIWENLKVLYDNKGIHLKYNELKRSIESNREWYMYEDFRPCN